MCFTQWSRIKLLLRITGGLFDHVLWILYIIIWREDYYTEVLFIPTLKCSHPTLKCFTPTLTEVLLCPPDQ